MKAWHFLAKDKKLGYGDNRLIRKNHVYKCKGELSLCNNGMHGSRRIVDALRYASGPIICKVDLIKPIKHGDDKCCARGRKVIWMLDGESLLHEFACRVAYKALVKAKVTDKRCYEAIKIKKDWLIGKASDSELNAAWSDAWSAAESDAWSAARSAAWSDAWSAARNAARSAARNAARNAARSAAWSAAWSDIWNAAWSAARSAAWSAARNAAWSAARSAQNRLLLKMVNEAMNHRKAKGK